MGFIKALNRFIKKLKIKYYYPKYFKFISSNDYLNKYKETSKFYNIQDTLKVFVFNNMNIVGGGGYPAVIFKNRKEILEESFFNKDHSKIYFPTSKKAFLPHNSKKNVFVDKLCNFARVWNDNYWHFTFQALPIIFALETQGYDGKYLVFENSFTKELLDLIGIAKEKIMYFEPNTIYRVRECHVIEVLDTDKKYANIIKDMRDKILSNIDNLDNNNYPKNIFIKRIGRRKVKNLDEINEILEKYNFKTIIPEELNVKEQIKYFYNANIVISPHGANSTNSIYMKKGSNFIESFGRLYVNPCCLHALRVLDVKYFSLNEYTNFSKKDFKKLDFEPFSDYEINPLILELYLKQI